MNSSISALLDDSGQEPIYELYVGNLPNHLQEEEIMCLFEKYNPIRFRLISKGCRCFAFVRFEDYSSLQLAYRQLNRSTVEGRLLSVRMSHKYHCSGASSPQDSMNELDRESISTLEEYVTEKDINMLKYCNLRLKRTKLELEVLKLRLEIQKLQRDKGCRTRNGL
ncbi:non-POU domain-containing octamer-binding protein-like [Mixophyes fleayi]|uniref:non-POU domain-containing octamer-binding protein-like n=1 Tax=Mixophyes fleayi TaxID=3061075 RepID=UPI003F4DAC91